MTAREDAANPDNQGSPTTTAPGAPRVTGEPGPAPPTLDDPHVRPIVEQFHAHTRYVVDAVLGEGGMGIVFRATDPELRRPVALKVIKEGSTEQKLRFMREAQAQARIAHDSICKVYEVGEVHGYRFIAMQYIPGWTLGDARDRLTLEQKISVMQRIAEALHEAHRLGLIHRDIKPGNIMVEQTEDGEWRPYLLDFGVLRDMEGPAVTRTGIAVGTPQYMAPEQILGHLNKLDRRTDVYGMGATFYELLGGKPPFHGETSTDLLLKALNDDPVPLQKIEPSTPVDIDHIIMKCLEKEPQRRYESARALSEDLQRYIAGDPVQARGTTWRYRTIKRIRKHKMVAIPVSIAIVIIMVLVGVGIRMQFQARHREVLARQLGQDLEEIDNIMRSAYMMPPHDIRREKKMVQDRIREIEVRMKESGRAGQAVGNFALGRAYRILEDNEKAVEYLQTAWDGGYREPEAAYELGLVTGHLYQEELESLRGITDQSVREARLKQAAQKYRDPAVAYLRLGQGSGTMPIEYAEALIAFYEKKSDQALSKVRVAAAKDPWPFEEYRLEGQILQMCGIERSEQGNFEGASRLYDQAQESYDQALDIARSHPGLHENLCGLHETRMDTLATFRKNTIVAFERGMATLARGFMIDPDNGDLSRISANLHLMRADDQLARGVDPIPELENAADSAERTIALRPDRDSGYIILGDVFAVWGIYASFRGEPPTELFRKSVRNYQRAVQISPTDVAYKSLGLVCDEEIRGAFEGWAGDPTTAFRLAVDSLEKARRINRNWYEPPVLLAKVYRHWAKYELFHGRDPRASIRRAADYAMNALGKGNDESAHYQMGIAYQVETEYCLATGQSSEVPYRSAIESFGKALTLSPDYHFAHTELARAHLLFARALVEHGASPEVPIREAIRLLDRAVFLNPNYADTYFLLSQAEQSRVEIAQQRGLILRAEAELSVRYCRRGLEINPKGAPGLLTSITAWLALARLDKEPGDALAKARALLTTGLALYPDDFRFRLRSGECYLIEGSGQINRAASPGPSFGAAGEALREAIALNPNHAETYRLLAQLCMQMVHAVTSSEDKSELIRQGLEAVEKSRSIHPNHPESLAIMAALLHERSRVEMDGPSREATLRLSRETLARAESLNPNMATLYRQYFTFTQGRPE